MTARRFVGDTLGMAASQYVARAALLVRGVVAAVALGPAGFGAWNALNLILDYGAFASAGALQGLDLRLPGPTVRGEAGEARRLLAGAWSVVLAGGAVFALLVAAALATGHPALLRGLGGWPLLMLAAALLQLAVQYQGSALRARGRFGAVSGSAAAQAVLGGGLGILLVVRLGIPGLLWGWLAGTLVALAWVRLAAPDVPLRPGGARGGVALVRGGFVVFASFLVSLVLRSVDRLALVRYGRPEDLGAYSLGLMAAGLVLYLPEAAANVLYPRIVAAADGALDRATVRAQVLRAQRALTVLLPPAVAVALVWVGPVLAAWMPQYRGAAGAVRLLGAGALLLSASTLPGYWLLGSGRGRALLLAGLAATALAAALVFGVASRVPLPAPVAAASAAGYGLFAAAIVAAAARDLVPGPAGGWRFAARSFLPCAWAVALVFAACRWGTEASVATAMLRSLAVALAYLPVLAWLGRGLWPARAAEVAGGGAPGPPPSPPPVWRCTRCWRTARRGCPRRCASPPRWPRSCSCRAGPSWRSARGRRAEHGWRQDGPSAWAWRGTPPWSRWSPPPGSRSSRCSAGRRSPVSCRGRWSCFAAGAARAPPGTRCHASPGCWCCWPPCSWPRTRPGSARS
jgi:O-antigen/teichoic acid export membrane protein